MIKIVTHSGSFHADDVFAIATLQLHLGVDEAEVVRTRDESVIADADWVVDVGGVYDVETKRFDHHQNTAPTRENGIPYAAFGLVWKEVGASVALSQVAADRIEQTLVQQVDAGDTGVSLYDLNELGVVPYELYQIVSSYAPAWGSNGDKDIAFMEAVSWAREFLKRLIQKQSAQIKMEELVASVYAEAENKEVLVFDVPVSALALVQFPDVNVIVYPDDPVNNKNWTATTVRKEFGSFESKVSFPEEWAGLRKEELVEASGIPDAVFCHKARFIFVAGSKEGVMKAVESVA